MGDRLLTWTNARNSLGKKSIMVMGRYTRRWVYAICCGYQTGLHTSCGVWNTGGSTTITNTLLKHYRWTWIPLCCNTLEPMRFTTAACHDTSRQLSKTQLKKFLKKLGRLSKITWRIFSANAPPSTPYPLFCQKIIRGKGGYPAPFNRKSLCPKKLSGMGGGGIC